MSWPSGQVLWPQAPVCCQSVGCSSQSRRLCPLARHLTIMARIGNKVVVSVLCIMLSASSFTVYKKRGLPRCFWHGLALYTTSPCISFRLFRSGLFILSTCSNKFDTRSITYCTNFLGNSQDKWQTLANSLEIAFSGKTSYPFMGVQCRFKLEQARVTCNPGVCMPSAHSSHENCM